MTDRDRVTKAFLLTLLAFVKKRESLKEVIDHLQELLKGF